MQAQNALPRQHVVFPSKEAQVCPSRKLQQYLPNYAEWFDWNRDFATSDYSLVSLKRELGSIHRCTWALLSSLSVCTSVRPNNKFLQWTTSMFLPRSIAKMKFDN